MKRRVNLLWLCIALVFAGLYSYLFLKSSDIAWLSIILSFAGLFVLGYYVYIDEKANDNKDVIEVNIVAITACVLFAIWCGINIIAKGLIQALPEFFGIGYSILIAVKAIVGICKCRSTK